MHISQNQERKILTAQKLPVYVVFGEYEFLQKELAGKIVRYLLPEDEMDTGFQRIDGSASRAMEMVVNAAGSPSLFGGTQVVFVTDAQELKLAKADEPSGKKKPAAGDKYANYGVYENLVETIKTLKEDTHVVFVCGEPIKKPAGKTGVSRSETVLERCFSTIDEVGAAIEFPRMYDNDLLTWVKGRAMALGIVWSADLAEMFLEKSGKDVRHIVNELEKLSVYFADGPVTEEEMRKLITSSEDFFVNMLIDYMLEGRIRAALVTLERAFKSGTNENQVISMVAARLRQMWQARYLLDRGYFARVPKEYGGAAKDSIAKTLAAVKAEDQMAIAADPKDSLIKKAPFPVFQVLKYARNYSLENIESALRRTGDAEHRLKAIVRPKVGTDSIMLKALTIDIAAGATGAEIPR